MLDTGAEITVIPTKLAQGLNIPYKKTKLCLTGVIGEDSVLYETPPIEVQDRAASVKAIPPPTTIKTLRSFLGTTGYCRPWIEDYASIAQPLYDLLKGHGKDSDTVCMEELHLKAFNDLKRALCQAPALGIAQSDRPFVLYVHEHLGFMTACLMQDHGGSLRPIHYYSGKLDIVAQGMGPCLRAVQAVHLALQASSGMVLGQTVNVKCPHAVSALMNQAKVTSVTSSRWGNWLATLTAPNIAIQRAPVTNPSSCMMSAMTEFVLEDEGEMTHDCVTLTYAATSDIAETPIENAELELFVDGSAQVIEGNRRAGYAVTSTTEVVASGRLPDHFSAQAAELVALTRACTLASGRNKPLEPKWYGPHQVMLITAAAVLCQGRKTWTHVSHCKVVPPPAGIG